MWPMDRTIVIHKGRTNKFTVGLGFDVSGDELTSEIRVKESQGSTLLATFVVTFITDGTDGELLLTLDDSAVATVQHATGYMDIKRLTGGEPVSVFDAPLPVEFRGTVTA